MLAREAKKWKYGRSERNERVREFRVSLEMSKIQDIHQSRIQGGGTGETRLFFLATFSWKNENALYGVLNPVAQRKRSDGKMYHPTPKSLPESLRRGYRGILWGLTGCGLFSLRVFPWFWLGLSWKSWNSPRDVLRPVAQRIASDDKMYHPDSNRLMWPFFWLSQEALRPRRLEITKKPL